MIRATFSYAIFLLILGIGGFISTGATTSLIPAFLGLPVVILAQFARRVSLRRYLLPGAAGIAGLGLLAALSRLIPAITAGFSFGTATISLSLLALSSAAYLIYGITAVLGARRQETGRTA
jgi:hypothetical protein